MLGGGRAVRRHAKAPSLAPKCSTLHFLRKCVPSRGAWRGHSGRTAHAPRPARGPSPRGPLAPQHRPPSIRLARLMDSVRCCAALLIGPCQPRVERAAREGLAPPRSTPPGGRASESIVTPPRPATDRPVQLSPRGDAHYTTRTFMRIVLFTRLRVLHYAHHHAASRASSPGGAPSGTASPTTSALPSASRSSTSTRMYRRVLRSYA